MKKLVKTALGVAMLAALFAGCQNSTYVANDTLDAPNLTATATDNGVIILRWDDVKDADLYTLYVKGPHDEEYYKPWISSSTPAGRVTSPYYYNVNELDSEYSFKLVASNSDSKFNLLSSETEESVTTPEEWKAIEAPKAEDIKIALTPNTYNNYKVSYPQVPGVKYTLKLVDTTGDAKVLFGTNSPASADADLWWSNDSIAFEDKGIEAADESIYYTTKAQFVVRANGDRKVYLVIKAEAMNPEVAGTAVYVSAANAVEYKYDESRPWFNSIDSIQTGATTARVYFTASKVHDADVDASKFSIYRTLTQNTAAVGVTAINKTSAIEKVAVAVKKDADVEDANATIYYIDDTILAYDELKAYKYTYYAVYEDDNGALWSDSDSLTVTAKQTAYKLTNSVNLNVSQDDKNKINVTVTAPKTATVKAYLTKFKTKEAALSASASEITGEFKLTKEDAGTVVNKGSITKNGVVTYEYAYDANYDSVNETVYTAEGFEVAVAEKTNTVTKDSSDGTVTTRTQTITTDDGNYCVLKVVSSIEGQADAVEVYRFYFEETYTKYGDADGSSTYALKTFNN